MPAREHRFEGWFASMEEFESQLSRKLAVCPVCSATDVSRMPSAPRLNLTSARGDAQAQAAAVEQPQPTHQRSSGPRTAIHA